MTNDELISRLGTDWRRQTADLDRLRKLTERRRQRTRLGLAARIAGAGVALLSGLWFVCLAVEGAPAIFALAGLILLGSLPLMLLEIAGTARALKIGHDDTPTGVLRRARDQAAMIRHLLWGARTASLLLGATAVGLLMLYATGRASAAEALFFVPTWGLSALGGWAWQVRRGHRLAAEIARCEALLAELGEAEEA